MKEDVVLDNLIDEYNNISFPVDIDYQLNSCSEQSSPGVDEATQAEYKKLLDTFDENYLSKETYVELESSSEINSFSVVDTVPLSTTDLVSDESSCSSENEIDDILSLLSEQYGVSHDSVKQNISQICALKRKNTTSVADDVFTKIAKFIEAPSSPASSKSATQNTVAKVVERRLKNNEASRVTRAKRKDKHISLFQKETELKKSNAQMKLNIESMQTEANLLRELLISKLSSVNSC